MLYNIIGDRMESNIIEYSAKYEGEFRNIIFTLAKHIEKLDSLKRNLIKDDYKTLYVDNLLKEVEANRGKIFLYIEDGQLLGAVVGIVEKKSAEEKTYYLGNKGEILEIYVDENKRGKHIGSLLIEKMQEHFLNNGCDEVRLTVFASNTDAIDFYKKMGFSNRNIIMLKELKTIKSEKGI